MATNKQYFWGIAVLVSLGVTTLIVEFITLWYIYQALEMTSYLLTRGA